MDLRQAIKIIGPFADQLLIAFNIEYGPHPLDSEGLDDEDVEGLDEALDMIQRLSESKKEDVDTAFRQCLT